MKQEEMIPLLIFIHSSDDLLCDQMCWEIFNKYVDSQRESEVR
jgi:hypothetical protein